MKRTTAVRLSWILGAWAIGATILLAYQNTTAVTAWADNSKQCDFCKQDYDAAMPRPLAVWHKQAHNQRTAKEERRVDAGIQ